MSKLREKYMVGSIDLFNVRNRNEQRIAECMRQVLAGFEHTELSETLIQDVYAFALNQLPARYTQQGTIVLRDPVQKGTIEEVVAAALHHVLDNPK